LLGILAKILAAIFSRSIGIPDKKAGQERSGRRDHHDILANNNE
jgi:hypothetical protein